MNIHKKIIFLSFLILGCLAPQQAQAMNLSWNAKLAVGIFGTGVLWYGVYKAYKFVSPHALAYASGYGWLEFAKYLIKNGADLNLRLGSSHTPLMVAALEGNFDIVQLLIESGADLNLRLEYSSNTALGLAIVYGHPKVAQLLIESGANLELKTWAGDTALIVALEEKKYLIAEILIRYGASVQDSKILLLAQDHGYADLVHAIQSLKKFQNSHSFTKAGEKAVVIFNELKRNNNYSFAVPALLMLYRKKEFYRDAVYTVALFEENKETELFQKLLKECGLLKCSKKQLKEFYAMGLPLTVEDLMMQKNLVNHATNYDFNISYK